MGSNGAIKGYASIPVVGGRINVPIYDHSNKYTDGGGSGGGGVYEQTPDGGKSYTKEQLNKAIFDDLNGKIAKGQNEIRNATDNFKQNVNKQYKTPSQINRDDSKKTEGKNVTVPKFDDPIKEKLSLKEALKEIQEDTKEINKIDTIEEKSWIQNAWSSIKNWFGNVGAAQTKATIANIEVNRQIVETALDVGKGIGAKIGEAAAKMGEQQAKAAVAKAEIDREIGQAYIKTGASIANQGIGLLKGIANVGEYIAEADLILATTAATAYTYYNTYHPVLRLLKQNIQEDKAKALVYVMWKGTMSTVADQKVESVYKDFYENNKIGQILDKSAFNSFKSTGTVTQISSGLGEVAGIVGISVLSMRNY